MLHFFVYFPSKLAMANAEEFCKNYLVIDAKKANLFDIACILICSTKYLNNKSFYNELSQDAAERLMVEIFWQRWLIFTSVLAQKFLIWAKEPMAWIGSLIETWLNLLSSNGGFFGLVINSIQGLNNFFFLMNLATFYFSFFL